MLGSHRTALVASTLLSVVTAAASASPLPGNRSPVHCAATPQHASTEATPSRDGRLTTAQMFDRVVRYMPHPDPEATLRVYAALIGTQSLASAAPVVTE